MEKELRCKTSQKITLDLKLNKVISSINLMTILTISSILLFTPVSAYSDEYSYRIVSANNSPYDVFMQYQIRDSSQNLICIVESTTTSYYDSPATREYLDTHPNYKIIEKNNQIVNYVLIQDSWTQGKGDTFLSAVKHIAPDYSSGTLFSFFFATSNGCAVQPGDLVTVYWKIFYL